MNYHIDENGRAKSQTIMTADFIEALHDLLNRASELAKQGDEYDQALGPYCKQAADILHPFIIADDGTTGVLEVEDLLWIQKVVDRVWEASSGGVSFGGTQSKALKPLGRQSEQIQQMLSEILLAIQEEQRAAKAQNQQGSP